MDSNGDGIGDFEGIRSHLDHLRVGNGQAAQLDARVDLRAELRRLVAALLHPISEEREQRRGWPSSASVAPTVQADVAQLGDDDFADLRFQADQDILDEVVGHGTGRGDLLDLERDGVGFVNANPDGEHRAAGDIEAAPIIAHLEHELLFAFVLTRAAIADRAIPGPEAMLLGAVVSFFDTLGIGSFAPTAAWMKLRRLVPDRPLRRDGAGGPALPAGQPDGGDDLADPDRVDDRA